MEFPQLVVTWHMDQEGELYFNVPELVEWMRRLAKYDEAVTVEEVAAYIEKTAANQV